jgi:hypothetical protein
MKSPMRSAECLLLHAERPALSLQLVKNREVVGKGFDGTKPSLMPNKASICSRYRIALVLAAATQGLHPQLKKSGSLCIGVQNLGSLCQFALCVGAESSTQADLGLLALLYVCTAFSQSLISGSNTGATPCQLKNKRLHNGFRLDPRARYVASASMSGLGGLIGGYESSSSSSSEGSGSEDESGKKAPPAAVAKKATLPSANDLLNGVAAPTFLKTYSQGFEVPVLEGKRSKAEGGILIVEPVSLLSVAAVVCWSLSYCYTVYI